jgi:endonuclease YncB( thermonuclease family)
MKFKNEILFVCLIGVLGFYPSADSAQNNQITAIDGDTIRVPADVIAPLFSTLEWSIRLKGVDTPEINGKCDKEKFLARKAKSYVDFRLKHAQKISVSSTASHDKWGGRVLANIYVDGKDLSQELIEKGYAVPYNGGTKKSWCN